MTRLFFLLTLGFFLASCATRDAVPDSFMVGQGVGAGDGTYLYLQWAIPQP
jgi:hypothetical protein